MPDNPIISVIIPTYNRKESLLRLLRSLAQQTCPASQYEVVVADDGSNDGTGEAVRSLSWPYALHYSWRANAGANAARNRGLDQACGKILLFLDDDMVADVRLVEEHILAHRNYDRAIIKGRVISAADEGVPPGPFARLSLGQPDLDIGDGGIREISYQQVGGGHFSIRKQEILAAGKWDETYVGYGFQDLEFVYRCWQNGMQVYYDPAAVTYHYDYVVTLAQACRRIRGASATAPSYLFRKHPELERQMSMFRDKGPIAWREDPPALILRKLARQLISSEPAMAIMERAVPLLEHCMPTSTALRLLYRWIISGYIYRGYREGLREAAKGASL